MITLIRRQVGEQACIRTVCKAYASLLHEFANIPNLAAGQKLHCELIKLGLLFTFDFLDTNLINMYAKCQKMEYARQLFDQVPARDVIPWTAIVSGYAQDGKFGESLAMFAQMRREGVMPNEFTLPCLFKACAGLKSVWTGKPIHGFVIKLGIASNVYVSSSLLDMYAKCGFMDFSCQVFEEMPERNLVSLNALLAGFADCGHGERALEFFVKAKLQGAGGNEITFSSLINCCVNFSGLEQGRQLHACVLKLGYHGHSSVGTALVDLYSNCGFMDSAHAVFDAIPDRDVIAWSCLIAGFVQNMNNECALRAFKEMLMEGISASEYALSSLLKACAGLAALEQGRQFHAYSLKTGFDSDVFVGSALLDMYGKSGSLNDAVQVFQKMPYRNVVSWNAMLVAYAQHREVVNVLDVFSQMEVQGFRPNYVTFVCVLSACSHAGLVEKGRLYFKSMVQDHGIEPGTEHYACMVHLFSHAGLLEEAENFMKNIPIEPTASMFGALLAACNEYGNKELGRKAAEKLFELDPHDSGTHVLLSNIYAAAQDWDSVVKARNFMNDRGVKKEPGCSWIEVKDKVHVFHANESSHPLLWKINKFLQKLIGQMKEAGYVPDTNSSLVDVEEQEKEVSLTNHSEMLALVFGLITLPPKVPIRIMKNLRICINCHTSIKFISTIVGREIIVRDRNIFHHFDDNRCSCNDHW